MSSTVPATSILKRSAGTIANATNVVVTVENDTTNVLQFKTPDSNTTTIMVSTPTNPNQHNIRFDSIDTTGGIAFYTANQTGGTAGVERMRVRNDGTVSVEGFTKLGTNAPRIRTAKITATSGATAGSSVSVGFSAYTTTANVLSATVLVTLADGSRVSPNSPDATENYSVRIQSTDSLQITNGASATTVLSRGISVFLVFEN